MAKHEEKELVKKKDAQPPAVIDFTADAGENFGEMDAQSYALPFLTVLQSMSPQVKKSDGAYVKGAEEGDLFNTVTEELLKGDAGVFLVPVYYKHVYIEYAGTISEGGGFIAEHSASKGAELLTRCQRDEQGNDRMDNGHVLVDIREHFCLLVKGLGEFVQVLLPLKSTQIKKSKKWMSLMDGIKLPNGATAPMYSQVYRLTTVPETKESFSWFGVKIQHEGPVTNAVVYGAAKRFNELIRKGSAKVDMSTLEKPDGFDPAEY